MAAVLNIPAAAAPAQPVFVYYRDFFADASNDVFNGEYAAALAPYHVPVGFQASHTPNQFRAMAFDARAQGVPTAFLLQHRDNNMLHIYVQIDHVTP